MELNVDYKDLRVDVRRTLALCSTDDCKYDKFRFERFSYTFNLGVEDSYIKDIKNIYIIIYQLYRNVFDYEKNTYYDVVDSFWDLYDEYYHTYSKQMEKFREYYEKLANNMEKYDDKKKFNESKLKKELKKNLNNGNYKKATLNYRTLINLYGVKKAKSIVKKVSKGTKANFEFVHYSGWITYVVHQKGKKGNKKETRKKEGNVYSIVAKKSSNGSGASTGAKKSKKNKTKTVTKKKK